MEQTAFLNIEIALKDDRCGDYKRQLIAEFARHAQAIRQELNRGVAPDEYQRLNKVLQALDAAGEVVETLWPQLQAA